MNRLGKKGLLDRLTKVKLPRCESCLSCKAIVKPFGRASTALSPLEIIYSDIWGLIKVNECHGAIYFLTFLHDYSRYRYVYLLSPCYEGLDVFKCFVANVET